jgi:hypothetical protein
MNNSRIQAISLFDYKPKLELATIFQLSHVIYQDNIRVMKLHKENRQWYRKNF